jgi:hypothetical protein
LAVQAPFARSALFLGFFRIFTGVKRYRMNMPHSIQIIATVLFAVAIIHTFSVPVFARLAHKNGPHAGLWHFLSEVEAVFGLWAFVLLVVMAMLAGVPTIARCPSVHKCALRLLKRGPA